MLTARTVDSGESDPDFVNHAPYKYERKRGDRIEKSSNIKQKCSRRSVLERVPGQCDNHLTQVMCMLNTLDEV